MAFAPRPISDTLSSAGVTWIVPEQVFAGPVYVSLYPIATIRPETAENGLLAEPGGADDPGTTPEE